MQINSGKLEAPTVTRMMKMYLVMIFALLMVLSVDTLMGQNLPKGDEFTRLICKDWNLVQVEMGEKKMPASMLGENYMKFKANGKYSVSEQGEKYSGQWSYDQQNHHLLTNDRDGKEKHKIIKLTTRELVTEITDQIGTFKFTYKSQ